jgi:hypothetical protein
MFFIQSMSITNNKFALLFILVTTTVLIVPGLTNDSSVQASYFTPGERGGDERDDDWNSGNDGFRTAIGATDNTFYVFDLKVMAWVLCHLFIKEYIGLLRGRDKLNDAELSHVRINTENVVQRVTSLWMTWVRHAKPPAGQSIGEDFSFSSYNLSIDYPLGGRFRYLLHDLMGEQIRLWSPEMALRFIDRLFTRLMNRGGFIPNDFQDDVPIRSTNTLFSYRGGQIVTRTDVSYQTISNQIVSPVYQHIILVFSRAIGGFPDSASIPDIITAFMSRFGDFNVNPPDSTSNAHAIIGVVNAENVNNNNNTISHGDNGVDENLWNENSNNLAISLPIIRNVSPNSLSGISSSTNDESTNSSDAGDEAEEVNTPAAEGGEERDEDVENPNRPNYTAHNVFVPNVNATVVNNNINNRVGDTAEDEEEKEKEKEKDDENPNDPNGIFYHTDLPNSIHCSFAHVIDTNAQQSTALNNVSPSSEDHNCLSSLSGPIYSFAKSNH